MQVDNLQPQTTVSLGCLELTDTESDADKYYSKLYIGPSDEEGGGLSPVNKQVFLKKIS